MSIFKGSGVAIVTPFKEDGSINYESYEKLIKFQIKNETDAIVVCGTTGEAATLKVEEQKQLISTTLEIVNKKVPVISGVGTNSTTSTLELVEISSKLGCDGLLVVTPYYNKTSQKGLLKHFTTVAKKTELPIILYNVPSRTGLDMDVTTIKELSKIKNIVGLKEASGSVSKIANIINECDAKFGVYAGNDDQIVSTLALGGIGVISVVANIAPKQTHDIVQKYLEGEIKLSLKLQLEMLKLINCLFLDVNPMPVKKALDIMGFDIGVCRMPLIDLDEELTRKLQLTMQNYGLIK